MSEIQTVQKAPLACVESLGTTPIDRMFRQIEVIVNKHSINVYWLNTVLREWKKGQKKLRIRLLLRIAVLFNVNPSVLLSSEDLESQVQIYNIVAYSASYEDVYGLNLSISRHLQNIIHSSGLTVSQIAEKSGLSLPLFTEISNGHVPHFTKLLQVLGALNIDVIDFFKIVESSPEFDVQDVRSHLRAHWRTLWENQQLQWIRQRITKVTDLSGMTRTEIKEVIGIHMSLLYERSIFFSSIVRLTNTVRINMSMFFNPEIELTSKYIKPEDIRKESLSREDIQKSYKVLIYLMKVKMVELGLPLKELAIKSGINLQTLKSILLSPAREDLNYLNLLKIVSKGFEMRLTDFLLGFEEYIEQFDHIDFDISLPEATTYKSQGVQDTLKHLESRATELINLTGISPWRIKHLTGRQNINSQIDFVRIAALLRFVHISGITFPQFAGNEDLRSLINPDHLNLERLPESVVTNALATLSSNIQRKLTDNRMSLSDLQIRMGAFRLTELNPILNGSLTVTTRKAVEVAQELDSDLPELFEGVSTF